MFGEGDQSGSSSIFLIVYINLHKEGSNTFSKLVGYQSLGIGIGLSGTVDACMKTVFSSSSVCSSPMNSNTLILSSPPYHSGGDIFMPFTSVRSSHG
jgi:hypothetical protein